MTFEITFCTKVKKDATGAGTLKLQLIAFEGTKAQADKRADAIARQYKVERSKISVHAPLPRMFNPWGTN